MSHSTPPWRQLSCIVLLACFAQLAADLYAPSLPIIAQAFGTDIGQVQVSMAIYMAALAISQLVYGPLSDMLGRRRVLTWGCLIAMGGSVLAALVHSLDMLLLARLIQGLGAGACACIWRAVFRDLFTGEALSKYASYLVVLIMFIMPAAPLLGSYLTHYVGWQANFGFLLGYAIVALIVLRVSFVESQSGMHRQPLAWSGLWQGYRQLLQHRQFITMSAITFLCYGAYFSWFSIGPVLLPTRLGASPLFFGWLTGVGGGACYGLAAWFNGRWVGRLGLQRMLQLAMGLMLTAAITLSIGWQFVAPSLITLIPPLLLFWFGAALIWPNANALAFSSVGHIAGSAAALYGALQLGGAACITQLASLLPHDQLWPLAMLMWLAPLLSMLIFQRAAGKRLASTPC